MLDNLDLVVVVSLEVCLLELWCVWLKII